MKASIPFILSAVDQFDEPHSNRAGDHTCELPLAPGVTSLWEDEERPAEPSTPVLSSTDVVDEPQRPAHWFSTLEPLPIDPSKGSKYCMMQGCNRRAKRLRRCWRHGGSNKCSVVDCPNLSKSRGLCWTHGGGNSCSLESCSKIAVSNGFCWAHGGGKRCKKRGCSRAAFQRTEDFCNQHYHEHILLTSPWFS